MPKSNIRPQKIVIYGSNEIHIKIITSVRLYYKIWSLIKIWRIMIFTWTKIEHNIICYISGRSSVRATYFCQLIDIGKPTENLPMWRQAKTPEAECNNWRITHLPLGHVYVQSAFSLFSKINQSACSTCDLVLNSQSELTECCINIFGIFNA